MPGLNHGFRAPGPEDGGEDLFCHTSALRGCKGLGKGDKARLKATNLEEFVKLGMGQNCVQLGMKTSFIVFSASLFGLLV